MLFSNGEGTLPGSLECHVILGIVPQLSHWMWYLPQSSFPKGV